MPDDARLDALELSVARLTKEVVSLRAEVRRLAGGAAQSAAYARRAPEDRAAERDAAMESAGGDVAPGRDASGANEELRRIALGIDPTVGRTTRAPRAAPSTGRTPRSRRDLEGLVGRYGTLALAALTILMGIGAFLGWAVRNGLIGPELRVAAGAVAAAAMAGVGWRLRQGTSPRFGDILLALSLAMVHVVCWGAGPLLGLVPDGTALAIGAMASGALAALSLREGDQSLFNVGFGGALLAPFVTSSGSGDPLFLLLYGTVVLGAGAMALRDRSWSKTPIVLMLGIAAYTASGASALRRSADWPRGMASALFALAQGWLALILVRGVPRSWVAHTALLAALAALATMRELAATDWPRFLLAAVLTATALASTRTEERSARTLLLGGLVLPLGAMAVALATLDDATSMAGAATALAWAGASAATAFLHRDGGREVHAFAATVVGGVAIVLALDGRNIELLLAFALYGVALGPLMRSVRSPGVALALFLWLGIAALAAWRVLLERPLYTTRPFLTRESSAGAAISLAWLAYSWHASRTDFGGWRGGAALASAGVRILGGIVAFAWVHQELASAFSRDVATFLLVAYYAVSGMLAIGIGRARRIPLLRQLGLALSVVAALKAIAESSSLAIGWRVAGYLLAGLFLLGVAYWYRSRGGAGRQGVAGDPGESGDPLPEAPIAAPR